MLMQRERLAQALIAHGNVAAAGREVWPDITSDAAYKAATKMLADHPEVMDRVRQIQADLVKELSITQRAVIGQLVRGALFDPGKIIDEDGSLKPLNEIDPDTRAAIQGYRVKVSSFDSGESVEKEVKFVDKIKCTEMLGKHLGMWKEAKQGDNLAEQIVSALLAARDRASRATTVAERALVGQDEDLTPAVDDAGARKALEQARSRVANVARHRKPAQG